MPTPDVIAIVWAPHEARTAAFATWLGARLYNVHFLKEKRPWLAPAKYVLQWFATWSILIRERPAYVFVTNSPPVAGLCVMSYCAVTGTKFVLDVHPPSLFIRKWAWARPLQRFTSRRAQAVLVDQERFARLFEDWGATTLVLRNPPRTIDTSSFPPRSDGSEVSFAYVGTFGADEPVEILIEAARRLPHVHLYLLGDPELASPALRRDAPPNVTFTGYIVAEEYWRRLHASAGVIVLTTHAHSLLGGAQDGLRVGRPLILSDQPTLREHFVAGTVFMDNSGAGLVRAIECVLEDEDRLAAEVVALREEMDARWRQDFEKLRTIVGRRREPAVTT